MTSKIPQKKYLLRTNQVVLLYSTGNLNMSFDRLFERQSTKSFPILAHTKISLEALIRFLKFLLHCIRVEMSVPN